MVGSVRVRNKTANIYNKRERGLLLSYKDKRKEEVGITPKKRGRPSKQAITENTKGTRKQVGRPKGDTAIMNEFKARLLASPKSRKVLDTILDAALNDEHKGQAAAWKILADRLMPLSDFEAAKDSDKKPMINITISGVTKPIDIDGDIIDGD